MEFQPLETDRVSVHVSSCVCVHAFSRQVSRLPRSLNLFHPSDLSSRDEVKLKRAIEERSFVFRVFARINLEENMPGEIFVPSVNRGSKYFSE